VREGLDMRERQCLPQAQFGFVGGAGLVGARWSHKTLRSVCEVHSGNVQVIFNEHSVNI
jgi:hypothetical protein